ncbi:MAG: hypothetical protein CSB46_03270 [Micrococcales bacterium]|nr:MAG: hypothetical protein CSB46_03270 [Micrococcales bacterium]
MLLLDVDHFKDVNDVLGHQTGDLLLRELGQRIAGVVRPGEVVARLGGDEFALLLRGRDVATRAHTLARQLLADLIEPLDLPGVRLAVQCSVGVAVVEAPGVSVNELVKRADIALYEAKRERASVGVYSQQACTAAARRLSLLPDLRDAIAAGELRVQYQPLIEGGTGKLLGAEALCRWRHPVRGPVSPADFIPLAENSGLIGGLTRLVLNQALQTTRQWLDCGLDLQVSVNISPRLVSDGALPELVAELLGRHQVPADRLTLEVTESSVVNDANRATVVLDQLRQVGVRLSMDDFGTGYSSLSVLQAVDVDELKLDRSFVSTVDRVSADAILVRSTIKLAHALGLTVVAEGVENEAVAGELRVMRCDHLQGNLFGRPMSAEAITALAGDRGLTRYRNQVVDLKAAERRREGYRQVL